MMGTVVVTSLVELSLLSNLFVFFSNPIAYHICLLDSWHKLESCFHCKNSLAFAISPDNFRLGHCLTKEVKKNTMKLCS